MFTKVSTSPKSGASFFGAKVLGISAIKGGTSNSHLQVHCPESATVIESGKNFYIYNGNDGLMPVAVLKVLGFAQYCNEILYGRTEFLRVESLDYVTAVTNKVPPLRAGSAESRRLRGC